MLTHEKLDVYACYKGNWENWLRSPEGIHSLQAGKPSILRDEDWPLISRSIQDLYLIQNGMASSSYVKELEANVLALCEDYTVMQKMRELVPYQYGVWDQKISPRQSLPKRFVDWVFRLFNTSSLLNYASHQRPQTERQVSDHHQMDNLNRLDLNGPLILDELIAWMDGGSVTLRLIDSSGSAFNVEFGQTMLLEKRPYGNTPGSFLLNGQEVPIRSDSENTLLRALRKIQFKEPLPTDQQTATNDLIQQSLDFVESKEYLRIAALMGRLPS